MIEFDKLEPLPRRRAEQREPERLHKPKRKHPKRHNENKERSFRDKAKAKRLDHNRQSRDRAYQDYTREVARYWRGERDSHPVKPEGL